ncbi:amidohydrolase family protein [Paraburkholderia phosphatilytica]|uniref:amidohydrolase family protein n=1 Tax=Paraburkholderia phosphatilytica TaxID=2282883 RepID=UPI001F0BCE45|nr:amidohydrolase family protein [Paraburkholderia phosphatilytica]
MNRNEVMQSSGAAGVAFKGTTHRPIAELAKWADLLREDALEPDLPIIDPHHHVWDDERGRYMSSELMHDLSSGHRIESTVFVQFKSGYRKDGPASMQPVGEVEFARSFAETCAIQMPDGPRLCEGIVAHADLTLGDDVQAVLDAMAAAGGKRLKGIRHGATRDSGSAGYGRTFAKPHLLSDPAFRRGFARLAPMGLAFDAWLFYPQLPDLVSLLRDYPDSTVVMDHAGGVLGVDPHTDRAAVFNAWRENLKPVASCPNVSVKIGGLGMLYAGWNFHLRDTPPSSEDLAKHWSPYVETCIDLFGPERCMFESNFPVDKQTCGYGVLWNAFKRITESFSPAEKLALYSGTAAQVYSLEKPVVRQQ